MLIVVAGSIIGYSANAAFSAPTPPTPQSNGGALWPTPSGGVFTCDWIAAHPAAAIHWRVSCDPAGPPEPVGSTSNVGGGVTPFATGCQTIPSPSTYAGVGVYAWTTYEYATTWNWSVYTNPDQSLVGYHWYLQHTVWSNEANGQSSTKYQSDINFPGNAYRWGAYNDNFLNYAQQYVVCYS
jgi:hypothetical protein